MKQHQAIPKVSEITLDYSQAQKEVSSTFGFYI